MSRLRGHRDSFKYAFEGIKAAFSQEPNFQIHTIVGLIILIVAALLHFNVYEWLLTLFSVAFVIILELINTTLEAIVDIISPENHPKAKIAKDVSAATVLVATITSVIVFIVLFVPKLIILIKR